MSLYRITIDLKPISYEIEAESEEKAIEFAQECFYDETLYDIIKYADIQTYQYEGEDKGMNSLDEIVLLAEKLVELTGGKVNG